MPAAAALPDAVVAAVLRPGYRDGAGDASDGGRGLTTGDNYTPAVIDAVAAVIEELRRRYAARAVLLVGHSGGAAIAADLLGRHPAAAAGALLVSCPCDVPAWRAHMERVQGGAIWWQPVASPPTLAAGVAPAAHVPLIVELVATAGARPSRGRRHPPRTRPASRAR